MGSRKDEIEALVRSLRARRRRKYITVFALVVGILLGGLGTAAAIERISSSGFDGALEGY
ncbi:MAG: hypothetical protein HOW73_31230 [Polyangiaceae bacterium]|nr:hypothetical protein [Polyangiaceae bacterium]